MWRKEKREKLECIRLFALAALCLMICLFSGCPGSVGPQTKTEPEIVNVKVTYKTEYGNSPSSITLEKNTALTEEQLPELTYEGYDFGGWFLGDEKIEAGYKVSEDITLVAKWDKQATTDPVTVHVEIVQADDDIELSYELAESGLIICTVTATPGYDSYLWELYKGKTRKRVLNGDEEDNVFEIRKTDFNSAGLLTLRLYATDSDDNSYSAFIQFTIADLTEQD